MAKEGRAGLGLLDRLVLVLAWIVTCGLVYLLGFYVGKGTQERRGGLEERLVRLPVTSRPPPEGQRPKPESDITFYDTLAGSRARERDAAPVPTTVPAHPPAPAPAAARPAPVPPAAPPRPLAAEPPAPPAVTPPATPAAASRPAPARVPPETAPAPGGGEAVARPAPPNPPAGGGWTVQASPTRSREEAELLYRQLRGRGYEATLVRVLRDGDTWYRVRIGRFATSAQANELMQRLREEGVSHVFVASE